MKQSVLILGGIIIDQYMLVDHFPIQGQDIVIKESFEKVGGCAINVATTLKNLECDAYIVANIGDDQRGIEIQNYIRKHGFHEECIHRMKDQMTGYSISLVENSGERTFLTYKGCEERFSIDMISPAIFHYVGYVYVTGYFLMNSLYHQEVLVLLKNIKNAGGTILFDPGPLLDQINPDMLYQMLILSDIVTPNEVEMAKIAEIMWIMESPTDWLLRHGVKWVLEKMGSEGVRAVSKMNTISLPAFPVETVDTTGAGDSFAGGILYSLIQGYPFEEALRIASACGALTAQVMGPHRTFHISDIHHMLENT